MWPNQRPAANEKQGLYTKRDFTYRPARDCYVCPAQAEVTFRFASREQGRDIKYYASSACQRCQIRHLCTTNKGGRRITRLVEQGSSERAAQRARDNPGKMRLRQPNRGAPIWDDEARDDERVLFDERVREGRRGDESDGPRL